MVIVVSDTDFLELYDRFTHVGTRGEKRKI